MVAAATNVIRINGAEVGGGDPGRSSLYSRLISPPLPRPHSAAHSHRWHAKFCPEHHVNPSGRPSPPRHVLIRRNDGWRVDRPFAAAVAGRVFRLAVRVCACVCSYDIIYVCACIYFSLGRSNSPCGTVVVVVVAVQFRRRRHCFHTINTVITSPSSYIRRTAYVRGRCRTRGTRLCRRTQTWTGWTTKEVRFTGFILPNGKLAREKALSDGETSYRSSRDY